MQPSDPNYPLLLALHGSLLRDLPVCVGRIPRSVQATLGWGAKDVFLTLQDAQKIRFHPQHGMKVERALHLPFVIEKGDYYSSLRGSAQQVEVVLHEKDRPKRAYFLVLARNNSDSGIFLRTFYFTAEISRANMRGAKRLLDQSDTRYFKL